jgi:hypothetical protein
MPYPSSIEGSIPFPYKSNKGEELDKEYEVAMNPKPEVENVRKWLIE